MSEKFAPYRAILRIRLSGALQYRAGAWAKLSTNIFWGYVRAALLVAFYRYGSGEAALTMGQAVSMIWLQQIALNLLAGFGTDFQVWSSIRSGAVGYELLRPIDLYANWYTNAAAAKLAPFLLAIAPVGLVSALTPGGLGLAPPVSIAHFLAFIFSLATGYILSLTAVCLGYAMAMDVRVGEPPANMFNLVVQIFSGGYIPLALWPDRLQPLLYWQPFAGMLDLPLRFYVGAAGVSELLRVVPLQLGWALALFWIGRTWIGRNLRRLVVQGG
ncbi:MAG: hypothetical protein GX558_00680 [Clostridiales bacterium]|nr:hypothetical protein [Clostridiales bacterium]